MKCLWLALFVHGQSLPLFPKELYCSNASVRLGMQDTRQGGVVQADIPCDSRAFGRKSTCCNAEDVTMVMDHLEHSISFGMRHLADRKEFYDQYIRASMQKHPCGDAPEAMLKMRLEKLLECHQLSEEVLGLLQATVSHLLCAACRGGVESSSSLLVDAEVALSDEWKRLSVATQKVYQEIRAQDAAIAGQMRQVGAEACVMDFIEAQRRGVSAPGTHVMRIRPWHSGEGLGGFQETWERYIDGLLGLSTELAESIMAEVTGLLLSFQHALEPSPAQQLLCGVGQKYYKRTIDLTRREAPEAPKEDAAEMTLLVAMPNPQTNLRFDFANDKGTLSKDALLKHVSALNPLLDKMAQGASLKLVLVTANPDQAAYLQRLIANHNRVRLVWRRFALFNAEELALTFAGPPQMDASRVVAAFQVKPGGDAAELHAAATLMAQLLGSTSAKIVWPPNLRPAMPSPWPQLVHASASRPGVAFRAASSGEGPCPELVPILKDYLDFHRSARAKLLEQATGGTGPLPRLLIYRCSAMGFCGGHGDRLNGLLSVFLMAVASRRAFFIDAARPVPMHLLLHPRRRPDACGKSILENAEFLLDWRAHGAVALPGRRTNYNDRYNDLVADLPWILGQEQEQVVVMHSNQRVTAAVLQSPEAQALMGPIALQLLGRPYLHAAMLELLFEPSQLLAQRHQEVLEAARLGRRKLIAVHFRAGDQSPSRWTDPKRHGLSDLDAFLACAQALEQRHRWKDADVAWYLAADTAEVGSSAVVSELMNRGKLAFLPGDQDAAIIHLDRSPLPIAVMGLTDTWAQWLTIASADGVILSASNFGVTAAEAGRVPLAYLGANGCLESDLTGI